MRGGGGGTGLAALALSHHLPYEEWGERRPVLWVLRAGSAVLLTWGHVGVQRARGCGAGSPRRFPPAPRTAPVLGAPRTCWAQAPGHFSRGLLRSCPTRPVCRPRGGTDVAGASGGHGGPRAHICPLCPLLGSIPAVQEGPTQPHGVGCGGGGEMRTDKWTDRCTKKRKISKWALVMATCRSHLSGAHLIYRPDLRPSQSRSARQR